MLLTSYRRDGRPVGTPVNIAVRGERGYVRSYDRAWKAKRMRSNPAVTVAPCTPRGRVTGEAVHARATLLDGAEARTAARALRRKHPLMHGVAVPLFHRLARYRTLYYALTPAAGGGSEAAA